MPELPEVEVLVRHLARVLPGKTVCRIRVNRPGILAPTGVPAFKRALKDATFESISRRGKYLLFNFRSPGKKARQQLTGHLGMTGRMYVLPADAPLPKHAAVVFNLGRENFVFEDTRYFGRLTLDDRAIASLGPEPLGRDFDRKKFAAALSRSNQAIKVRLLDQSLVAGIGNIYASEALFRAGISPRKPARRLKPEQVTRLWKAIRATLTDAIRRGSTLTLDYSGTGERDGLFYFGRTPESPDFYEERLQVYDRAGKACRRCGTPIRRLVQAARSTYYCAKCQV